MLIQLNYYCHTYFENRFQQIPEMKKIFLNILLLLISCFAYSQTGYGPEQKIIIEQHFPPAVRPGSDFIMEIKINKGNVGGLAKFQQYIPAGMTATAVDNAGADFSFEAQNVKFIWTSVPQDAGITIRYRITVSPSLSDKKYLSGTFSYVENDRTKKMTLVPKEIHITPTAPAVELASAVTPPATAEPKPVEDVQPVKTQTSAASSPDLDEPDDDDDGISPDPASATPAQADTKTHEAPVETTAPAPASSSDITPAKKEQPLDSHENISAAVASGIVFRVQIAAINERLKRRKDYFQEKFGIQLEVATEMHEGLKKFTVGNFTSYAQATRVKEEIQSSIGDSFVVAYKDGVRIPVAEALELIRKK